MKLSLTQLLFQVGPQEIYVVGRDDDDDGLSDDGASWETVDENEMDIFDDTEKVNISYN